MAQVEREPTIWRRSLKIRPTARTPGRSRRIRRSTRPSFWCRRVRPIGYPLDIIDALKSEFNIDTRRIYVAGQSDGGVGTWNVIEQRPNLFAAAIPLCGAGDPSRASRIAKLPIWAFHGTLDEIIPVVESRKMITAIRRAGGRPKYTEYGTVGHDVWIPAFTEPDLVGWLFSQHR